MKIILKNSFLNLFPPLKEILESLFYVLNPFGVSLDFAPYENSEAVHAENLGACGNTCFNQISGNSWWETDLLVTGSTQPRTSTVRRTTPNHRLTTRVKKTSLGESLVGSHAYNPIRDSRRDFCQQSGRESCWEPCRDSQWDLWRDYWRDFSRQKVSPRVSARVSDRIICMTPGETLSETHFFTRAL